MSEYFTIMKYSLKNLNLKPGNSGSNQVVSRQNREYHDLFRFIAWLVGTSLPVTTLIITLGILSGSLTIIAITIDYGLCIIPLALAVIVAAVKRYLNPPEAIDLGLTLLFFVAVIRLAVFAVWITRLGRRYPDHSPLLKAYYVDYRASFVNESAIFAGWCLAWLLPIWANCGLPSSLTWQLRH